ncbi:hypothetical protein EDD15DRAFT_2195982 [Pisolithus albus]|nr:hypothetical protein EDD15DRAFT_2195982 [Pisolithus albus]
MAPIRKLYGDLRQYQTKAILSAAIISGLEIEQPPTEFGITNGMSSLVPEAGLLGHNTKEIAQIDQWIHFAEAEILIPESSIYIVLLSNTSLELTKSNVNITRNVSNFRSNIILAVCLQRAGQTVCGAKEREHVYPHTFAFFAKVNSDERIKHVFGESDFVHEPLTFKYQSGVVRSQTSPTAIILCPLGTDLHVVNTHDIFLGVRHRTFAVVTTDPCIFSGVAEVVSLEIWNSGKQGPAASGKCGKGAVFLPQRVRVYLTKNRHVKGQRGTYLHHEVIENART